MLEEGNEFLIVGLGNPGASYEKTRHNAGFCVVEAFGKRHALPFHPEPAVQGRLARGKWREKELSLLLPSTFVNASGKAVQACIDAYRIPLDHLMVVSDDVALPLGSLRIRSRGSSGGHNGLKSIQECLRTPHYARLKIGVGEKQQESLSEHVLGRFSEEEWSCLEKVVGQAIDALETWLTVGIAAAMQQANAKQGEGNA